MNNNQPAFNYTAADIEKYWKGELSPAAQHAIEKAALEDPFLADALEGFAQRAKESNAIGQDLQQLQEQLAARVAKSSSSRVISMQWWKVAAFIIVLLGAGWLFVLFNKPSTDYALTKNTEKPRQPSDTISKDPPAYSSGGATDSSRDVAIEKAAAPPSTKLSPPYAERSNAIPVPPAPTATDSKNEELRPDKSVINEAEQADDIAKLNQPKKESANASRLETAEMSQGAISSSDNRAAQRNAGYSPAPANLFNGHLTDQTNKPVANAVIQIPDLKVATQTDDKGNFAFRAKDTAINAALSSDGFMRQNIYLRNKATLNEIVLQSEPAKDRDVIVQSNGAEKKRKSAVQELTVIIPDAEPVTGWEAFREYLQKNKKVPADLQDVHGNVVISFDVHARWFGNYSIEESLDDELDAEAIRLIKQGPAWKLLKGKKAKATVIVKF